METIAQIMKEIKENEEIANKLKSKISPIKMFIMDVDGVLTNGEITYDGNGKEIKSFNVQDGFGLKQLKKNGIKLAIITCRESEAIERRSLELGIDHLFQNINNKAEKLQKIINHEKLQLNQIAYMGDDWNDLPVLKVVGLKLAPINAVLEVKKIADYITKKKGGEGAVREVVNLILKIIQKDK